MTPGAVRYLQRTAVTFFVAATLGVSAAQAQYFGRNKVQYGAFEFEVLKTEHFDILYYESEKVAAELAGRMAERWYSRLGTAELLAAWEARLAYRGEAVIVSEGEREVVGRMLGLSQEGRLRVRTTDGGDVEFVDGEVSLRPVDMAGESDTLGAPFGGSEVGNDVR